MSLLSRTYSPIGLHFGSLETRILQLRGGPGHWRVGTHAVCPARGKNRHALAVEKIAQKTRNLRLNGKDTAVSMSGDAGTVSLVPVDAHNRSRLNQLLAETARRSIADDEGVSYQCLPLLTATLDSGPLREEYLLLSVGQSELRRTKEAVQTIGLRPIGLEMDAFATARALQIGRKNKESAWGFVHIGFGHSFFGVVSDGEIGFLKPLHLDGQRLLQTLNRALDRVDEPVDGVPGMLDILAASGDNDSRPSDSRDDDEEGGDDEDGAPSFGSVAGLATLKEAAVGHAVEILHALRLEAEALAQEVRACIRHFANRHKGASVASLMLTGFGVSLPEVEKAVSTALGIPSGLATPFTDLDIKAPESVLKEQHLWCAPLGLALRGYE